MPDLTQGRKAFGPGLLSLADEWQNHAITQKAEVFPLLKRKLENRETRAAWRERNVGMDNKHRAGTARQSIPGKG